MNISDQIRQLADAESPGFHILARRQGDLSRPLLVVVHPGDITETSSAPQMIAARSSRFQRQLAQTITDWPGEVAILHRFSCYEIAGRTPRTAAELCTAIEAAHHRAVVVAYGDDLPAFATLLGERARNRPRFLITGAYRDPRHGCVDTVADLLTRAGGRVEIDPNAYTAP
ncbi:MAG: hypothetical protein PHE83_17390 [Opitutaceae bacterium]|nr:hypothetical protein [Opitutaceae bacterium]